jgi:hypothetical protein
MYDIFILDTGEYVGRLTWDALRCYFGVHPNARNRIEREIAAYGRSDVHFAWGRRPNISLQHVPLVIPTRIETHAYQK